MRPLTLLVAGGATLIVLCLAASTVPASASEVAAAAVSPFLPSPPLGPPRRLVFYGNVATLGRTAGRWILRVDPAAFLSGVTAQRAAVEDGAIGPGEAVPNDYYVRNASKRLLTYVVAPNARITVITAGIRATRVPVAELAALVKGRNPGKRKLFGSPTEGYWVQVRGDTVLSMDQQYRP
jgi:hypothetical protein